MCTLKASGHVQIRQAVQYNNSQLNCFFLSNDQGMFALIGHFISHIDLYTNDTNQSCVCSGFH